MEEGSGAFITGVELVNSIPLPNPVPDVRPRAEEKTQMPSLQKGSSANKQNRSATALTKSVQPAKSEAFPPVSNMRDSTAKAGMRASMTEANFKKPLFKKLATVREHFDKNRSTPQDERAKSSSSKPLTYWKTKNEDDKNYTHADAFNQKIVQKFDDLYKNKEGISPGLLENLSKRKHLVQEVEKQEDKLQNEQKKFNQITYDIIQKGKTLKQLLTQDTDLEKKLVDTSLLQITQEERKKEVEEMEVKIEVEEYRNKCLVHMKQLKKELLLSIKKKYLQKKDIHDTWNENVDRFVREAENDKLLYTKKKLQAKDLRRKNGAKDNIIDPEFEELLEDEMSEFEERRNIREMFKHEKIIEEEHAHDKEEELKRTILARENRSREEENKRLQKEAEHEKELNKIKAQYQEFQKVTHVSKKDQLIEYFDNLEERSDILEKEIESVNETIKARKEELKDLKKQLKFKKFEETEASKDNFPKDIRLDDLEVIMRDKQNDANDRENNIKRIEKLSYEVCTVVSRVLKQLQKTKTPKPIDKANVVDILSICGLKLERMLTVVIKKKKTFFIESINTDGTIKEGPPSYMNIVSDDVYNKSKKRFEKERPNDIGEEADDDEISKLRDKIKNHDDLEGLL